MAYNSLEELKRKEGGFAYEVLGTGTPTWNIVNDDRGNYFTLLTLVGGNIAPGVEDVVRQTADNLGANLYTFGAASEINRRDAQRLRITPTGYDDKPLADLLSRSIGISLTDHNGSEVLQLSGRNRSLVQDLQNGLGRGPVSIRRTGSANNTAHPVNRYISAGGVEIAIRRDVLQLDNFQENFPEALADILNDYWNDLSGDEQQAALRPTTPQDGWGYDLKNRVNNALPSWLRE